MSQQKKLKDMRDGQRRIARLIRFYRASFIHMLFNRVLAFYSIIYGIFLFYSLLVHQNSSILLASRVATVLFWLLITPQFIETVKGLSMSWSRGMVFGRLNDEYVSLIRKRYGDSMVNLYQAIPYIVGLLWVVALVAILGWWS
ncbi:MAG: hypothetical protein QXV32_07580 [Conexivisphaerales archaeon]